MDKSNGDDSATNLKRNAEDNRTTTSQAAGSNNASNPIPHTGSHRASPVELMKNIYDLDLDISNAVEKLANKLEHFSRADSERNVCYKEFYDLSHSKVFDAIKYLAIVVSGEKNVPQTSGHAGNSTKNTQKAGVSENKREECVLPVGPHQVGPSDMVLILDSTLFNESGQVQVTKTAGDDYAVTTCVTNGQNQSVVENQATIRPSEGPETEGKSPVKRKTGVLDIGQPVDFKAKHLEPIVTAERGAFRVSFDVSLFDIENITCSVGDKLEVRARVSRQSDYGSEMHEIHRVFEVPKLVDREKFTAYIKHGFLHLEAPMKPSTEALMNTS